MYLKEYEKPVYYSKYNLITVSMLLKFQHFKFCFSWGATTFAKSHVK